MANMERINAFTNVLLYMFTYGGQPNLSFSPDLNMYMTIH